MALSIPLPAGGKIVINGVVVENAGAASIVLAIHNKASILREQDVLNEAEANTPAKEIYHSIQNAYLFEGKRREWLDMSATQLARFKLLNPEAAEIANRVQGLLADDRLYNALRLSRRLIAFEAGDSAGQP